MTDPVTFATYAEAEDMVVTCSRCGLHRTFSIVGVHTLQGVHYVLERCDRKVCTAHCLCEIPTLTNSFEHGDIQAAVSMYV